MTKRLYYEPILDRRGNTTWACYPSPSFGAAIVPVSLPPQVVEELYPSSEWEYIAIKNDEGEE